mmetsp:Transcript_10652/g.17296  ORF Transcript_10652/g.17296 Transcript_10652/m.17296 type:complete len:414 (-) Transcript_10652:175-1416(-)
MSEAAMSEQKNEESKKDLTVRVLCYNILAGPYCRATEFFKCKPDHCNKDKRFARILKIVQAHMKQKAIICLQEVTEEWAGKLHSFFAKNDYHMITSNYNIRSNSGHMGVALAFPQSYSLEQTKLLRPSRVQVNYKKLIDAKSSASSSQKTQAALYFAGALGAVGATSLITSHFVSQAAVAGDKKRSTYISTLGSIAGVMLAGFTWVLASRTISNKTAWPEPTFEERLRKVNNVMLLVKLKDPVARKSFWVSTYHMPCQFWDEQAMVAYASLCKKQIFRLAKNDPVIFAGDFNSRPESPSYHALTQRDPPEGYGDLMISGKALLPLRSKPFYSAYQSKNGQEPDFTNYAVRTFKDKLIQFMGCIDYIFISDHWKVASVLETPDMEETKKACESYPTEDQPSDHLPIAAELVLTS